MFTPYHPSAVFCYGFGMTNDPIHLSVVIPAFNEEKKIAEDISIATDYLDRQSYVYEIIVVDDGSRDRTADVARDAGRQKPQVRVILQPGNLGKGAAVRTGMQAARGAFAVFADAGGGQFVWTSFPASYICTPDGKLAIDQRDLRDTGGALLQAKLQEVQKKLGTGVPRSQLREVEAELVKGDARLEKGKWLEAAKLYEKFLKEKKSVVISMETGSTSVRGLI